LAAGRPRRSTRTNIDYANPDAGTIIAEVSFYFETPLTIHFQVDDEEPGGLNVVKGGRRSTRGRAPGAGRKRKAAGSEDDGGKFHFNNYNFSLKYSC
jgi:hypothetical protein